MKNCSSCGRLFRPRKSYYHECPQCWRPIDTSRSGPTYTDGYLAGRADGYRRGYVEGRAAHGPTLPGDLLMAVVRLTHPDRHPPERFAEANRVTARLLSLRDVVGVGR